MTGAGPLAGLRVVEMAGIGPGPFAAMMLADMGAEVLRIDRPSAVSAPTGSEHLDLLNRGRRSAVVDVKAADGVALVLDLVGHADALLEGYRPGVMERLGLGPEQCLARNPRLVYGRVTGWGQEGPYATTAGHDIDFIAISGALHTIGRAGEAPVPPVNYVGDFGGGGMLLAYGVLCGVLSARATGQGQVVDAAMVDGAALQTTMTHYFLAAGLWQDERGVNHLDTGAPFYEVYETADQRYLAVGAVEPEFYAQLLALLGIPGVPGEDLPAQYDRASWPALKERFAAAVRSRTLDEWLTAAALGDACVAPVLSLGDAPGHPQNVARGTFTTVAGVVAPAPAPRFSATPGAVQGPPPRPGEHTDDVLADWGVAPNRIAALRRAGAIV